MANGGEDDNGVGPRANGWAARGGRASDLSPASTGETDRADPTRTQNIARSYFSSSLTSQLSSGRRRSRRRTRRHVRYTQTHAHALAQSDDGVRDTTCVVQRFAAALVLTSLSLALYARDETDHVAAIEPVGIAINRGIGEFRLRARLPGLGLGITVDPTRRAIVFVLEKRNAA